MGSSAGTAAPGSRTKPFAGEAERSGKRGYCAAFNEALPVQQRLETLPRYTRLHLLSAQRLYSAHRYTARSAAQRPALHCAQRFTASVAQCVTLYTPPPPLSGGSRAQRKFAGEAERSGKRGYCAAFNEALPVEQRLESLQKVCALAFAFSAAHIQRAALHSAHL